MRVHIRLSPNRQTVPFNYQPHLTGAFHKWTERDSNLHDNISLYSFSWLQQARAGDKGLDFPRGSSFFASIYDLDTFKKLINGIRKSPDWAFGMRVTNLYIEPDPELPSGRHWFKPGSPFLVKRSIKGQGTEYYTHLDQETEALLTETLQHKLKIAGIDDPQACIELDKNCQEAKTKIIDYKGIKNKTVWSPVFVTGSTESLVLAWNVGIGNSTGIGFGSLV